MTIFHNPTSFSKKILHESYIAYHFCDILSCVSRHSRKNARTQNPNFLAAQNNFNRKTNKTPSFLTGFQLVDINGFEPLTFRTSSGYRKCRFC